MDNVAAAARQRQADQRAAAEQEFAEHEAALRAAKEREDERLERERRAPERLAEGRRLAEGFVAGGRIEFRTLLKHNPRTGTRLEPEDWHHTQWQAGTLTKVVCDGHVKCPYGVAWLEVMPDCAIPGFFLRTGESYIIPLREAKRESAGVYECARVGIVES